MGHCLALYYAAPDHLQAGSNIDTIGSRAPGDGFKSSDTVDLEPEADREWCRRGNMPCFLLLPTPPWDALRGNKVRD